MKTAILVDGGFYRRRAQIRLGDKTALERADELYKYCLRHLHHHGSQSCTNDLYRIFYYDCLPRKRKYFTHYCSAKLTILNQICIPGCTFLSTN